VSFATGLEGFAMLLPWFRCDLKRGHVAAAEPRWFQWGYITHWGDYPDPDAPGSWYILIRLPSYLMKPTDYDMGPPAWHQRVLLFKEGIPAGAGGWQMTYWLLPERAAVSTSTKGTK
jgi:hypothetical protein